MNDIRDKLTAYGRMSEGIAKSRLRDTLIEDGASLNDESIQAERYLERNWDKGGDDDYIEALAQYTGVCDLRDQIRREVLEG